MTRDGSAPVIVSRDPAPGESPLPEDSPEVIAQIPRTCICAFVLVPASRMWRMIGRRNACPWHGQADRSPRDADH